MQVEEMFLGTTGLIIFVFVITLVVCAILMPLVVVMINSKVYKVNKNLEEINRTLKAIKAQNSIAPVDSKDSQNNIKIS